MKYSLVYSLLLSRRVYRRKLPEILFCHCIYKLTFKFINSGLLISINMPATDQPKISKVIVHPLVLLSVVDHFNRMKKIGSVKRVVGVLLGSNRQGVLDVSNSFAGRQHIMQ